jgi:hypothetical protein
MMINKTLISLLAVCLLAMNRMNSNAFVMSEETKAATNEEGMKCEVDGENFGEDCKKDDGEDQVFTEYEDLEDLDKIDFYADYDEDLDNNGNDKKAE